MKVRMPEGSARPARPKRPARREGIRCPTCGSHRLVPEIAFIAGARYFCKDCGFRGALVVEGMRAPKDDPSPGEGPP